MIRSSALLITAALALLVAGVFASSLELVYVSIGVSLLAAIVLSIGVFFRRGELFGAAGPARQGGPADWPAADVTSLPGLAGDRTRAESGDRENGDRTRVPRQAAPVAARGPAAARRTRERPAGHAGGGRPAKPSPAGRGSGSTDGGLGWPRRADREEAPPSPRDRDRAAAAWEDRDAAAPERRDRRQDRGEAVPARDRDQPAAAWEDREAAPPRPPGFRVPPFGDRPAMTSGDQPGRGSPVRRAGDGRGRRETPVPGPGPAVHGPPGDEELRDRGGGELTDDSRHDQVRPAWAAAAGPRAMGTGPATKQPPAEPVKGDGEAGGGPEPPGPPGGFRPAEPPVPGHEPAEPVPGSPQHEQDRDEQAAAPASGAHRGLFEPLVTGKPPETGPGPAEDTHVDAGDADEAGLADRAGTAADAHGGGETEDASGTEEAADGAEAAAGLKPAKAGDRDEKPGKPRASEADSTAAVPLDGDVTVVPGITRYHRRACILIRFLSDGDLETMTRASAEEAGSAPCKACQPDKAVSDV